MLLLLMALGSLGFAMATGGGRPRNILLGDLVDAKLNFAEADFWIVRRGPDKGKPTKTFHPDHIGVKVTATDVLLPAYAFYLAEYLNMQGIWGPFSVVTVHDLLSIPVQPT